MVFEYRLIEKLIETEVELIELSFKISDKLGEVAVESAMNNFYDYLCKGLGKERFIASMNMEYRKFIIDLTQAIPEKLLPKAMPVILGIHHEKRG